MSEFLPIEDQAKSPVAEAVAALLWVAVVIAVFAAPAVVIAAWRWAL